MSSGMKCECLFCQQVATARFTAPHLKPRFFICEEHLETQLEWMKRYHRLDRVTIEPLEAAHELH